MEKLVESLTNAISRDIVEGERSIYRYVLPCNPEPYPISGFQHFFGTAFVALRLAEFAGLSEEEQVVAFLAGLIHDYEKMGLSLQEVSGNLEGVLGADTDLYETLSKYATNRLRDAVEIASKLGSGGLPRRLQMIAEFVRLGDYVTGGEESWNIVHVMDRVGETLDSLGVKHYLVPVVVGKQRPVIAMIAEKLNEELIASGLTPLVSTPTGSLYLSKSPFGGDDFKKLYGELANYISSEVRKALASTPAGKPKVASLRSVSNLVRYGGVRQNVGNVVSLLPNLRQLSPGDIEETFKAYASFEDKVLLVIWSALVYAKTLGSVKENLLEALDRLGLWFAKGRNVAEVVRNLYSNLVSLSPEALDEVVEDVKSKLIDAMLSVDVDVDEAVRIMARTVNVGGGAVKGSLPTSTGVTCAICREKVHRPKPLRAYLDRVTRVLDVNVSELFHPDRQGRPEDHKVLEGLSSNMYICPVCEIESIIFPVAVPVLDGMWAAVVVYNPAASIDLLEVVKRTSRELLGEPVLVMPDYASCRMVAKTSDARGHLRKSDLLTALDLWYYVGGNLVLTTNALSVPRPWSGLPIEVEFSDVVIEESVNQFMRELRLAKERGEWSRTRLLRRILYSQLRTYVMNLEEAEVGTCRTRFAKSGLVASGAPALDVYSYLLRKLV